MSRKALAAGEFVKDEGKTTAASALRLTIGLPSQVKCQGILCE